MPSILGKCFTVLRLRSLSHKMAMAAHIYFSRIPSFFVCFWRTTSDSVDLHNLHVDEATAVVESALVAFQLGKKVSPSPHSIVKVFNENGTLWWIALQFSSFINFLSACSRFLKRSLQESFPLLQVLKWVELFKCHWRCLRNRPLILHKDVMQHTRTPFPTIPRSNSMWKLRLIVTGRPLNRFQGVIR